MNKELKTKAKLYVDANVWDGEDRSGTNDWVKYSPDDLQELVDEVVEEIAKLCSRVACEAVTACDYRFVGGGYMGGDETCVQLDEALGAIKQALEGNDE